MMVQWLPKYRLSADAEESSEENVKNYVGKVYTTDDLGIQSDLIDQKELYSIKNPKFTDKVHPIEDHRLVHEFDPKANKVDKLILDQVVGEPKHHSSKSLEKHASSNKKDTHALPKTQETTILDKFSINNNSPRLSLTVAEHQDTGDEDRLL